jgi:predicted peptidase
MRSKRMLAACMLTAMSVVLAGSVLAQQRPLRALPGGGQGMVFGAGKLPPGAKMHSYRFEPTGEKMQYAVFVPRRLKKDEPMPLVIALHGAGGAPESILNPLAAAAEKHRYIVAAPMGYTATGWYGFERRIAGQAERETSRLSEMDVMSVLSMVRAEYNIDPRRIYVVGASMGGVGAVHLAMKYPDIWAAVGAISPAITANVPDEFSNYSGAPVVVLHGDHDDGVPVDVVRGWVARLKELKVSTHYFEFQGGTHISVVQHGGEQVFEFFDQHVRPGS